MPASRPGAVRVDLGLDRMVAQAVRLGQPRPAPAHARDVQAARTAPDAPDWLRNVSADALDELLTEVEADLAGLLHDTHGADVAARLLADPPRVLVDRDGAVTVLGCFGAEDGPVSLAGFRVRRDGPRLLMEEPLEQGPLPVRDGTAVAPAPAQAGPDDCERRVARLLVPLAARHRLRPVDPTLNAAVVLPPGADPDGLLPAAALVAGAALATLELVDPGDTKAREALQANLRGRAGPILVWGPADTTGWVFRSAKKDGRDVAAVTGPTPGQAADDVFALLLGRTRYAHAAHDPPSGMRRVDVTLVKEGTRGANKGDDLRLTDRTCRHKKRRRAMGAEAKVKGAKNVEGLPDGAVLQGLMMCGDNGCHLCWASYRIAAAADWPPAADA